MAITNIYVDPSKQTRTAVTIANSTTTATVTQTSHGYSNGDTVKIQGAAEDDYNGNFTISNVTTDTYDYTMGGDPGGSATGSPLASKLNLSGDDGTTSALAYADLQYALDQKSAGANRFCIKAGTSEVLNKAIDLTSYGSSSSTIPLSFQGYATNAQDYGIATIDGDGRYAVFNTTGYDYLSFLDLRLINTGANVIVHADNRCAFIRCEFSGTTGKHLIISQLSKVIQCYFTDGQGVALGLGISSHIENCFFANSGATDFVMAIDLGNSTSAMAFNNLLHLDNASVGIGSTSPNEWTYVYSNSVLCNGGTGTGIYVDAKAIPPVFRNNIVEGFSGVGGTGFLVLDGSPARNYSQYLANAAYNNTTNYDETNGRLSLDKEEDNETLTESAFAKEGSLPTDFTDPNFWSDVYAYFAPVDTGNVLTGYPSGSNIAKGAVQPAAGGGGGGGLLRVNMNGNVFG